MIIKRTRLTISVLFFSVLAAQVAVMADAPSTASRPYQDEDEIDLDAPPATPNRLTPSLYYGGRIDFRFKDERNFDLDSSNADTLTLMRPRTWLAFTFRPDDQFKAFFNLEYIDHLEFEEEGKNEKDRQAELRFSQANMMWKNLFEETSLTIGRQRFNDDREWLYDEELDGIRIAHKLGRVELDGAIIREGSLDLDLLENDDDRRVDDYMLRATFFPKKKIKIAPYFFHRQDRSQEWSRPTYWGVHSSGEITKRLDYWADIAWVHGREKKIKSGIDRTFRFQGFGFDIGAIYEFDSPMEPSLALGFAFGNGSSSNNDKDDRGFRQTGLQDNSDKLTGVIPVRYYGELFDPELSNMMIFTAATGIKPRKNLSLEVIYHYYLQEHAASEIRNSNIDADPTGLSKNLGSEIDLVLGFRHKKQFDIKAGVGVFLPGNAFGDDSDDMSFLAKVRVRYKF